MRDVFVSLHLRAISPEQFDGLVESRLVHALHHGLPVRLGFRSG